VGVATPILCRKSNAFVGFEENSLVTASIFFFMDRSDKRVLTQAPVSRAATSRFVDILLTIEGMNDSNLAEQTHELGGRGRVTTPLRTVQSLS
jgi:hypothetical protein